ncbi:MAG: F0F1 ATP synthase subunit delta, partial [Candidatus Omnitrophica bacterium]|nr:F0F1 ATP synthase subunit delta [Candidatus Omnitrophota bacterium]
VRDLIENGFKKIGQLKIIKGIKEIKVLTAFPLSDSDRAELLKKVNKLLGSNMDLKEELDPKIVAGIIVEIGSLVLDGSLRHKILGQVAMLDASGKEADE